MCDSDILIDANGAEKWISMNSEGAFNKLRELVGQRADIADVGVPARDEDVKEAENFLQLRFPETYITFLRTWGTLSIGPCEYYGMTGADFQNSKIPNGIWFTNLKRKQVALPSELIVISDNNGDEYYCLDTRSENIVAWDVAAKKIISVKSDNLFSFILSDSQDLI